MLALALLLAAIPMIPVPDEVVFKNGEKVVGTITQVVDGKITITSDNLGTVTAPLDKVSTFSTDHDIDIVFADGTTVNQK